MDGPNSRHLVKRLKRARKRRRYGKSVTNTYKIPATQQITIGKSNKNENNRNYEVIPVTNEVGLVKQNFFCHDGIFKRSPETGFFRKYSRSDNYQFSNWNNGSSYNLSIEMVEGPYSGGPPRPLSANDYFRSPTLRQHSFSDDHFDFQYNQDSIAEFSFKIRTKSLFNLNDNLELPGQNLENRFQQFQNNLAYQHSASSFTRPTTSQVFDMQCNSANEIPISVHHGAKKRKSLFCDDETNGLQWDGNESYNCGSWQNCKMGFDSLNASPHVKRRKTGGDKSTHFLSISNNTKSEGTSSGLSLYPCFDVVTNKNYDTDNTRGIANVSSKLVDESCGALDILMFPSDWCSMSVNKTGYVDIPLSSSEGISIKNYFLRTSATKDYKLCISEITRVENPFLHSLYLFKKEEMERINGHVDEVFLYHGTKEKHILNICEENLNWRLYSNSHRFGKGVSFSPSASYSSHYSDTTNEKHMLLYKVLISKSTFGSSAMNIPYDMDGTTYDTSIKGDASVIVKYSDNEFYPLYKIKYTKHSF